MAATSAAAEAESTPAGQSRPDALIVLPRPSILADPGIVASPLIRDRLSLLQPTGHTPRVFQPTRDPEQLFQSLGFADYDSGPATIAASPPFKHVVRLRNLGGYIAYGPLSALDPEPLIAEIGNEFVVVRDHVVYQQNNESFHDAGDAKSNWHPLSGIRLARDNKVSGKPIRFGIVDTGIDADHAEFRGRRTPFAFIPHRAGVPLIEDRMGCDPYGHGTHISSLIAGRKLGICPEARLCVASVLDGHSLTSHISRIVLALDWLLGQLIGSQSKGYPIILNLSLGVPHLPPGQQDPASYAQQLASLESAAMAFTDGGALVVAAIGNDGYGHYRLPAGMPSVLAVGAADELGAQILEFSGNVPPGSVHGHSGPDVVGFGQEIPGAYGRTISAGNRYAFGSGTSQATAYVSGIAGLYWTMQRQMKADEVRQLLLETAYRPKGSYDQERWGAGLARFHPPAELLKKWKNS